MGAKNIIGKAIRRECLGWNEVGKRATKSGEKFLYHASTVSGWGVIDGNERKYRRFKRKSSPSRTVIFTVSLKWQIVLVIINLAALLMLLKMLAK